MQMHVLSRSGASGPIEFLGNPGLPVLSCLNSKGTISASLSVDMLRQPNYHVTK